MTNLEANRWKVHVAFWSVFIVYEISVVYSYTGILSNLFDYAGHYLLNISFFYFNTFVLLEYCFKSDKPKYVLLGFGLLLELVLYIFLKYFLTSLYIHFEIPLGVPYRTFRLFLVESIWRAIYFIGISIAYRFVLSLMNQQKKIAALELQHLSNQLDRQQLENAFLRSQINPHFLFNTLNFLYNSVAKVSAKDANTVLLLSDMMRHALSEAQEDGKVDLDAELLHIKTFIELAQMRHGNELNVQLEQTGDTGTLRIIPLALMTLIENIFKYADLKDVSAPAYIGIKVADNKLDLRTRNKKRAAEYPHNHGIGVKNVKKRLDSYYSGNYSLSIQNQEDRYNLHLTINL